MDDIQPGDIPVDQFQAADSPAPGNAAQAANNLMHPEQLQPGDIPIDQFETQDQAYGGIKHTLAAAAEGALKGAIGPLAPLAERAAGITAKEQRERAAAHPVAHGAGEALSLLGGALTGTGEAALMGKAGELAADAAGLADVVKGSSYAHKVGSAVVKQAAEMSVLQGSDEASKRILKDPEASTESALSNIGLAAAIGGAGGAFTAGVVSPLWSATVGPKLEGLLNMVKNHVNGGGGLLMHEGAEAAAKDLGIEVNPVMRSGMSEDPKARTIFGDLRRAENKQVLEGIEKLHADAANSVMNSLGVTPEEVAYHSENEAGHDLLDTFKREYASKYEPLAEKLAKREADAAHISVSDEERLHHYGRMLENGMEKLGTDSPYYKLYEEYGNRLLKQETIGGMDKLKTEINNRVKGLKIGGDFNTIHALNDIKNSITDFQEMQIAKAGRNVGITGEGVLGEMEANKLIEERAATNKGYRDFAKMSDDLTNHLGIGDFRGEGTLRHKLTDKISAEDLLKKFSIRGNADFAPFLKEYFPETLDKVLQNERKQFLKPAILAAAKKGELPVDAKKLSELVQKGMAGKKEYVEAILPPGALRKIESARILASAIPSPKDSGTPAGLSKIFKHMPASALAAVGWFTGHNPIVSLLLGETASNLGKDVPEALKLGYLKLLSSDMPVKSEGFKAMVDFIHASQKGETLLGKATANVFKPGFQVLTDSQMPGKADVAKLSKLVSDNQKDPNKLMQAQQSSAVGHYMPQHQVAIANTSARALQYLQGIKPKSFKSGPLDKEVPPSPAEEARYNRALEIAEQPLIVLKHIKDGTIQTSDLVDLKSMYPSLYQNMSNKITSQLTAMQASDAVIPYKVKIGTSLFLGQPLDSSMTPSSIMAAQPQSKQPSQPQDQPKQRKSTSSLGKNVKSYQTPGQASESRRVSHD